jgi:putative endonuclease
VSWRPFERPAFDRQGHNRGRGRSAEDDAERWLKRQGYRIVERNHVNKGGEIDVVALDRGTLCFVEIKARGGPGFGSGLASVDPRKQRRLARAAALYLASRDETRPCRFDVLAMERSPEGWSFDLVRDAFSLPG